MKVSELGIVVPTYNSGKYVAETLRPLLQLQELGCSVVVVDSGSKDHTVDIVEKYGFSHLYFPPGNMYSAINFGMRSLTGKWLTYINSDDLLNPQQVVRALEAFGGRSDMIVGNINYIDSNSRYLFARRSVPSRLLPFYLKHGICVVPQAGTLFTRELYERCGGFNDVYKYAADYDFFLKATSSWPKVKVYRNGAIASFRLHDNQLSNVFRRDMGVEVNHIMRVSGCRRNHFVPLILKSVYWVMNVDKIILKGASHG